MPRNHGLAALVTASLLAGGLAACALPRRRRRLGHGRIRRPDPRHRRARARHDHDRAGAGADRDRGLGLVLGREVPLALGVLPVGMAAANFGVDDGDGLLPWVSERLEELDAEVPVLFDETDGIDFEAVADTRPDVILAGCSGLTQEDSRDEGRGVGPRRVGRQCRPSTARTSSVTGPAVSRAFDRTASGSCSQAVQR